MTLMADRVRLGFDDKTIIDDLSVSFQAGEITCLLGPNGSGKSTLLKGLSGAMTPWAGAIQLDGKSISAWAPKPLARRLAVLPQHPIAPEGLTVKQLVRYGRFPYQRWLGQLGEDDHAMVAWAISATGLSGYEDRALTALSGGERQRAWIALTLAQQADFILLDEPTTYLDLGHQLEIMELLVKLNQDHGISVVMSLHDLNQAARYSHRLAVLCEGRIVAHGLPEVVLTQSLLRQVFRVEAKVEMDATYGKPVCVFHSSCQGKAFEHFASEHIQYN